MDAHGPGETTALARRRLIADPDLTVYVGDALHVLPALERGSVDAIVTSPPYADTRREGPAPSEFPAWLAGIGDELAGVLAPSGSWLLNLGRIFRNDEEHPYIEETLLELRRRGWLRVDTIIWHKPNAHPFSGSQRRLHGKHEFVFWLARTTMPYRGIDECRQPYTEETLSRYGRSFYGTAGAKQPVGRVKVEHRRDPNPLGALPTTIVTESIGRYRGNGHPTPMPLELAEHLVKLACPPAGVVLDPFFGSGTTGLAARRTGRRCVGVELNPDYVIEAGARTAQGVIA